MGSVLRMFSLPGSLLLVASLAVAQVAGNDCPPTWVDGSFVDMGCLMLNANSSMSWEDASRYCYTSHSARLVEFRSPEQLEFVQMELEMLEEHEGQKRWWTSGTDLGREGFWYWTSSLAQVQDFVWSSNYSDGGITENCLYLYFGSTPKYMGNDYPCGISNSFDLFPLCQMK